ncbi:uncharacterized protein LOC105203180 isoform X1 [Solenopsis invicta]|uniref:uncharacterized protein LOC105203180 isoform X1 n=2 Tax=Solenopsis invicta TaxID=13686 RepID=UPI00193E0A4E|nr:uncharacterized protein LOC105203180 isoform X1 [Solenopsis invicta]XP_039314424.1 uncharacterized protein LOC105203180 isoform X1 [Solenopsis invicta]
MKPFAVVRFRGGEESVEVVSTSWICEDKGSCKWPPKNLNNDKITRLIMSLSKPTPEFDIYLVTVMHEYDKYQNARKASKVAEDFSDLDTAAGETDLEGPRKKRKTKYLYDSEESYDESPQIKKKRTNKTKHVSSDEENEILNSEKMKKSVRVLLNDTKYNPKGNLEKSSCHTKASTSKTSSFTSFSERDNMSSIGTDVTQTIFHLSGNECSTVKFGTENTLHDNSNIVDLLSVNEKNVGVSKKESSNRTSLRTLQDVDSGISDKTCPTIDCNKCEILLKTIIEQIEEINGKFDYVCMSLARVHRKLTPEDSVSIKPKDLPILPLKDEEAFYAFDNFLKNDDNFLSTVDYFVVLMPTGKNEEVPIGNLLSKIFSNSLARIINYSGSGSVKIKLQGTNILTVIECAVVKKFPTYNVTELHSKILRWFSTSNQRKINT